MMCASVCDGIGAALVAWKPLGWRFAFKSEIEPFPLAVTHHRHPEVPDYGDMTDYRNWNHEPGIELLVGGTPCQAFSAAGLRKGLADPRGNLTLVYLGVVERCRPRWVVWENVPGVLSDRTGAFGAFLGGLAELGYGFAYRVLDAQYYGVAQRRRRVFVVGHAGGQWQRAAAVLFERASLSGDPAPRREPGEGVAAAAAPSLGASGRGFARAGESRGQDAVVATLTKNYATHHGRTAGNNGGVAENQLVPECYGTLRQHVRNNSNPGTEAACLIPELACAIQNRDSKGADSNTKPGHLIPVVNTLAFQTRIARNGRGDMGELVNALNAQSGESGKGDAAPCVAAQVGTRWEVRRLTPRECERLQGFPDDYTQIAWRGRAAAECPDGPRYKALGNSMAVPVMRWIGERITRVDAIPTGPGV